MRNIIKILFLMFLLITPLSIAAKDFSIKNDSNTFLFVNGTTGMVGIGTTAPGAALDVVGAGKFSNGLTVNGSNVGVIIDGNPGDEASITFRQNAGSTFYSGIGAFTAGGANAGLSLWAGNSGVRNPHLYIRNSGNVGIGTTSPNTTLHVAGTINVTSGNDICISGSKCLSQTGTGSGSVTSIQFNTSGLLGGTITASGSVDLNYTYLNLLYNGTANLDNTTILRTFTSFAGGDITSGTYNALVIADDSHNHIYSNIDATTSANWATIISDETGTAGYVVFSAGPTFTGDVILPGGNWSSTGNVGIGLTNPLQKLHVGDGTGVNIQIGTYSALGTTYSAAATVLGMNVAGNTVTADGMHYITAVGLGGQAIRMKALEGITFHTIATGSESTGGAFTSERMRINELGNVGIGTTAPSQKLDVNGSINMSVSSGGNLSSAGNLTLFASGGSVIIRLG